jgi:hypothetical protein
MNISKRPHVKIKLEFTLMSHILHDLWKNSALISRNPYIVTPGGLELNM